MTTGKLSADTSAADSGFDIRRSTRRPSRYLINKKFKAQNKVALLPEMAETINKTPDAEDPEIEQPCYATWDTVNANPAFDFIRCGSENVPVNMSDPVAFFTYLQKRTAPATPQPFDITLGKKQTKVVAIGDLHGDIDAFLRTLWYAGLINGGGCWIGGTTTVVQLGDQIDRVRPNGPRYNVPNRYPEIEVLWYTELLKIQAVAAGGEVYSLLGNHEMYSTIFDSSQADYFYRQYASASDLTAYTTENTQTFTAENTQAFKAPNDEVDDNTLANRHSMFIGGHGLLATKLFASRGLVVKIGNIIFSHADVGATQEDQFGGIENIKKLNAMAHTYLATGRGDDTALLAIGVTPDKQDLHPVWNRQLCAQKNCELLPTTNNFVYVSAHTPQKKKIEPTCNERVWCIDTERSAAFGEDNDDTRAQSLEIVFKNQTPKAFRVLGAGNIALPA